MKGSIGSKGTHIVKTGVKTSHSYSVGVKK